MGDQESFDPVKWFEKCAIQILLAHRLIDDDSLKRCFQKLCIDRPQCRQTASRSISDLFRRLNIKLRLYGMEVKTVAIKVDGNNYFQKIKFVNFCFVYCFFFLSKCFLRCVKVLPWYCKY